MHKPHEIPTYLRTADFNLKGKNEHKTEAVSVATKH
jgi:hypothetical protein